MNTRIISYVISNLFKLMMFLLLFPLAVSVYYQEGLKLSMAYIIPIIILGISSYFLSNKAPENQSFFSIISIGDIPIFFSLGKGSHSLSSALGLKIANVGIPIPCAKCLAPPSFPI